jgi:hypothetical protein
MSMMILVSNAPESLYRDLVRQARASGQSLNDYILDVLAREVARPPATEIFERVARRTAVRLGRPAAELIGEERSE